MFLRSRRVSIIIAVLTAFAVSVTAASAAGKTYKFPVLHSQLSQSSISGTSVSVRWNAPGQVILSGQSLSSPSNCVRSVALQATATSPVTAFTQYTGIIKAFGGKVPHVVADKDITVMVKGKRVGGQYAQLSSTNLGGESLAAPMLVAFPAPVPGGWVTVSLVVASFGCNAVSAQTATAQELAAAKTISFS